MELKNYMSSLLCGTTEASEIKEGIKIHKGLMSFVETCLVPLSMKVTAGLVTVYMQKDKTDPYKVLNYKGVITILEDDKNKPYYKITVLNPVRNLDKWIRTSIVVFGQGCKEKPRLWAGPVERTSGQGPIPDNFADLVTPKGPFEYQFDQNTIRPGENVCARWEFRDGQGTIHEINNEELGSYWKTVSMTGGFIKEKIGDYSTKDLMFVVVIEGVDINCRPSDHVKWEVGDYVFIAKLGIGFYIIPLKIDGGGA